jgi:hypothetical protein
VLDRGVDVRVGECQDVSVKMFEVTKCVASLGRCLMCITSCLHVVDG